MVLSTLGAFRAMGVHAEGPTHGRLVIHGVGLHGLKPPADPLDMGNSGTAMRPMAGQVAGQACNAVLIGDESLSKRPMTRVADPLAMMGAHRGRRGRATAPAHPGRPETARHRLSNAHGQRPGEILPVAGGPVRRGRDARHRTGAPTRDHTGRMLRGFRL